MRQRQHWTKEQKAEFWAAFVRHRDEGCNIREAWRRAYADFQAEGKIAPGLRTFGNRYRAAMRPQREDEDQVDPPAPRLRRASSAEGEAAEPEADDAQEEAAPDPDYTARLQMMVLLYRRRSDSDCDAVCDRLLPELTEEEE